MKKLLFTTSISLVRMLSMLRLSGIINTVLPDRGKFMTLITSKWQRLLMVEDGRQSVYDKKPQCYAKDNRTAFNYTQ